MLLRPQRVQGGFVVRNSVSDGDPGWIVKTFPGWLPVAWLCAWVWYRQHFGDPQYQ